MSSQNDDAGAARGVAPAHEHPPAYPPSAARGDPPAAPPSAQAHSPADARSAAQAPSPADQPADASSPMASPALQAMPGPTPAPVAPPKAGPDPGRPPWRATADNKAVFRRGGPLVLWWLWVAFALFNFFDVAVRDHDYFSFELTAGLLALTAVVVRVRAAAAGCRRR